ncbi:MAG: MarR family transcriptional regulator [Gammaproteobacteria bacterium]|nr:MarR family transcriptional regulator [Gammaproteobacteria bacterium]
MKRAAGKPSVTGKRSLRLWLRLLGCSTLIEQHVRTRLRDTFRVTLPQFDVLAELDAAGAPQTMSALSRRLMVSNGNVTGVIDRLERVGLVQRTPSTEDRRVHYIALTPHGRRRFAAMAAAHEGWVDALLGELDDADRLVRLLERTKQHLRAQVTTREAT